MIFFRSLNRLAFSLKAASCFLFLINTSIASYFFGNYAYITNGLSDTVSVIETDTNSVVSIIAMPDGSNCQHVAITPDRQYAYVSSYSANTVSIISTTTNSILSTITDSGSTFDGPFGITFSPDGLTAYVSNNGSNTVSIIDTTSQSVTGTITVGNSPTDMITAPDTNLVYVANNQSDTVSVIDTSTNTVVETISVGSSPFGLVLTPDGESVYVSNKASNTVSIINTTIQSVIDTVGVGSSPRYLAVDKLGEYVYVADRYSNQISFIETSTHNVSFMVLSPSIETIFGSAFFNNKLYLTDIGLGTVYVVNPTNADTISITLEAGINHIAIVPNEPILPPASLTAYQTKNVFLTQTDFINALSWQTPSSGTEPVNYFVYRDSLSNLIGTVSADTSLTFIDHNRSRNAASTYYVVSVSEGEDESSASSVTL